MNVVLVIFGKKSGRKEFTLNSGPLVIGRKIDADLRIPVAEVSRDHCEITVNGDAVKLRDLGSSNGTFVNSRKVVEAVLKAGDRIAIGPVTFTLQIDGVPKRISPPAPATSTKPLPAAAEPPTVPSLGDLDEFDIDGLEELDIEDISDLDLDDLTDTDDSGVLEEIDEVDLLPDDDSRSPASS